MAGVRADHHDATVAANDAAIVAHRLNTRTYFHGASTDSFVSVGNTASGEVVRSEFHLNLVAWEDADVMHAHFSGDVRKNFMVIVELDLEHGVR